MKVAAYIALNIFPKALYNAFHLKKIKMVSKLRRQLEFISPISPNGTCIVSGFSVYNCNFPFEYNS